MPVAHVSAAVHAVCSVVRQIFCATLSSRPINSGRPVAAKNFFSRSLFHYVFVNGRPHFVTLTCIEGNAASRHKAARKKFILPKQNGAKP